LSEMHVALPLCSRHVRSCAGVPTAVLARHMWRFTEDVYRSFHPCFVRASLRYCHVVQPLEATSHGDRRPRYCTRYLHATCNWPMSGPQYTWPEMHIDLIHWGWKADISGTSIECVENVPQPHFILISRSFARRTPHSHFILVTMEAEIPDNLRRRSARKGRMTSSACSECRKRKTKVSISRSKIGWPQSRTKLTFHANCATVEDQHVTDASERDASASTMLKKE
jgi:hypothetical protein